MHILLAEDTPEQCTRFCMILEAAGHTVTVAQDGAVACRLLDVQSIVFDAVITDMQMPRLTGMDVLRTIQYNALSVACLLHSSEDAYRGEDLTKVSQKFPFATFRHKLRDVPEKYLIAWLSTLAKE